jgi:hypothetical protein
MNGCIQPMDAFNEWMHSTDGCIQRMDAFNGWMHSTDE